MSVSSIYKLLDTMEMMFLKGVPIPFTPWVFIHHEKVIHVLDKIRASIPGEIQEAHSIIKKRDDIFIDAQNKANQIISEARAEADKLLSESEVLQAVQSEAERIRNGMIQDCERLRTEAREESERVRSNAINEALQIREGADRYAESILVNLDNDLTQMHGIVKNAQQQLSRAKADSISKMTTKRRPATSNIATEEIEETSVMQNL